MSNAGPSGHEPTAPVIEPYREAYVKHNLKKNEIPIILNFRKFRTATKAHGLQEMPKGADTLSGNTTTAVVRMLSSENINTIGHETPLGMQDSGLADQLKSSLVVVESDEFMESHVESDEVMGNHSEMMDEEFISADEGSDETIKPTHIGSHPPMSPDNAVDIATSSRMPTHSLDFNLPRDRLSVPGPGKLANTPATAHNHTLFGADLSVEPTMPIPVDVIKTLDDTALVPLLSPSIVQSAGERLHLPRSNLAEPADPLQDHVLPDSSLGKHHQRNEFDMGSNRGFVMTGDVTCSDDVASPMEDVDCTHSIVHSTNIANEGVSGDPTYRNGDQVYEMHMTATDDQGPESVHVHRTRPNCYCSKRRDDKHCGLFPPDETDEEVDWEGDDENEVDLDQDSIGELITGGNI